MDSSRMRRIDFTFLSRVIGKTLTVTMVNGQFRGTLIHVDHGQAILLSKVKDLSTNITMSGVHLFHAPDILHVELHIDKKKEPGPEMHLEDQDVLSERVNVNPLQMGQKALEVKGTEATSYLENMHVIEAAVHKLEVNFTVIDELRTKFGNAMGDIQQQAVIGVTSAGSNVCRHGSLYSLQVATKSRVYLFDIAILGPSVFTMGLKTLLEDKSVVKVVHDCRRLSDCLYHQYGIVLNNVFDTQVADILLFHTTTGGFFPQRTNSLEDCLVKYLKMETSEISFLAKTKEIIEDHLFWSLHPMSSALQKSLSLEASYILSLYMTMANAMMADFTSMVDGYIKVYTHNDVTSAVQFSDTELPHQFRRLKDSHRTRQERAVKEYVADEHGLLAAPGKNLDISGKDSDKNQMTGQSSTLRMKRDKWATEMTPFYEVESGEHNTLDIEREHWETGTIPFKEVKSEGHNTALQVAPYHPKVLSQSFHEYSLWPAVQNPLYFQFPRSQLSRQAQRPFSPQSPTPGSSIRMSAARLLARTSYSWCT
ncbi:piRNA biogenesis protein EXD1-like isoform X2 [Engystomops pustulosus]